MVFDLLTTVRRAEVETGSLCVLCPLRELCEKYSPQHTPRRGQAPVIGFRSLPGGVSLAGLLVERRPTSRPLLTSVLCVTGRSGCSFGMRCVVGGNLLFDFSDHHFDAFRLIGRGCRRLRSCLP